MDNVRAHVLVCTGGGCVASGALEVRSALQEAIYRKGLDGECKVVETGCLGPCAVGPVAVVYPDGVFYEKLKPEDAEEIVEEHLLKGRVVERLVHAEPLNGEAVSELDEIGFFRKQRKIVLRNCGVVDPQLIEEYIARDGYQALAKALTAMTPEQVIDQMKRSGLRGRGGAGFPTGLKWQFTRQATGEQKFVLCNADEGDPGAFMDRSLLEGDPHSVIEGMAIAAYAVGSAQGYVYVRAEYPLAIKRLTAALEQAREYGLLGSDILGTGFAFDLEIRMGSGAFVCGEETALMTSIEGHRGEPRPRPPFPAQKGLWGMPSLLNNVETYGNVPVIIQRGADWFSSIGTELSKGTKVFSVVGKVKNTGLVEVPMGTTLGDIIFGICGGIADDRKFKAVQIGGPSGGCIPAEHLNLPVDYESLTEAGAMMGSGGMVVTDESTCMVDMAHFFLTFVKDESCGKCTPCREGIPQMLNYLTRIKEGKATMEDLEELHALALAIKDTSLCGLGKTAPNPFLTTYRYFKQEYIDHIKYKRCEAGVCSHLVSSPCHHTCPIDTEASSYIALIAQGKFKEAYDVNIWANPLPSVCARVCHHPCETTCKAGKFGSPIAVRDLKRFVTDYAREQGLTPQLKLPADKKEKVAVVGSGPAGLMAGWELRKKGYQVTIYESEAVPGGMLSWGIPEYRLPKEILYSEIDRIQDLGVEIKLNTTIGKDLTIDDLLAQGYQAVFIATGTPVSSKLGIPGEDRLGVIDPIAFLKKYNLEGDAVVGKKVAVVGGGNTAFDAARTAWRLGADVTILYRRTRTEMPANVEDIEEAIEEGIKIEYLTIPVEAYSEDGRLSRIRCQRMALSKFDKSGRRRPIPVEGSDFELETDTLIPAIGAEPDLTFLKDKADLQISKWKTLEIDTETMATNVAGIFAAGDVVTGPATVLEAMGGGKRAADSIDRYLRDASLVRDYQPTTARLEVPPVPFNPDDDEEPQRVEMHKLTVTERQGNFNEVEQGLTSAQAIAEAKRCLRCDLESLRLRGEG